MNQQPLYEQVRLTVYNSLTREREPFQALNPPHVGMYVCGPTVYGDPHLGHARTALAFDVVFRFLSVLGYSVRYVRNITDVGHLEDEAAEAGEDKILKRARLDRLEPMEIVHRYTRSYHDGVRQLNCLPPSIEPSASGHIIEQIQVVERILAAGLAYEHEGSVYFDLEKYVRHHDGAGRYGQLSGKVFDDLLSNTRDTAGSSDKRSGLDFALWKRAEPAHIMRWPSPWGEGFPGWHLECTTMSTKYLGEQFDIHGGGLDLQFPHHEAEIAQNHGAFHTDPARYWLHSNMLTVGGQKMAKSLGNFITLEQIYTGDSPALEQPYHPMVVRFFMLQSHYRSSVDFSNPALQAAEKGYRRLMTAVAAAQRLAEGDAPAGKGGASGGATAIPWGASLDIVRQAGDHGAAVAREIDSCWEAMADDFHTPRTIAALFELGRLAQQPEHRSAPREVRRGAADALEGFTREVLGLVPMDSSQDLSALDAVMEMVLAVRREARERRDFATADSIRDGLAEAGIRLEDRKDGTTGWECI